MVASSPSSLTTSLYKPSLVPRKAFLHLQQPGFNAGLSFSLHICMTSSSNRHLTMLMLMGSHAFLYPIPRESPWCVLWNRGSSTSLRLSHSQSLQLKSKLQLVLTPFSVKPCFTLREDGLNKERKHSDPSTTEVGSSLLKMIAFSGEQEWLSP